MEGQAVFKMVRESYKIAERKAQELLKELSPDFGMVDTDKIVELVQEKTNYNVKVYKTDFSRLGIKEIEDFGGLISIIKKKQLSSNGQAAIYLNSKNSPQMMRFSLMHEVGHLVTAIDSLEEGKAYASPLISADITYLNEERIKNNAFLEKEQAANIFALSILMPKELFQVATRQYTVEKLSNIFGVTEEAVLSRFLMLKAE